MRKRIISMTAAFLVMLTCSGQVLAAPLIKPKEDTASSSASSAPTAEKEKTVQYAPPVSLKTALGRTVTNADVAAIIAKEPRAFYSIPGDDHDGTLQDERKGMDFRQRERQPFEFFPNDVDRILMGRCKFDDNGKLREYDAEKGAFWSEELEKMLPLNRMTCYDSWTIAWFDKNETAYMYLNAERNQLQIVHPPKSACPFIKKVLKALIGDDMEVTPNSHIGAGMFVISTPIDALNDDPTVCTICGRKRT